MTKSVFEKALDGVRDVIASLSLDGIESSNIVLSKQPWVRQLLKTAGVLVCPQREQSTSVTNQSDDVSYGVLVAMATPSNQDLTTSLGDVLLWRQQIWDALANDPLSGVPEIYTVRVEPAEVFWEPAFLNQWDVSALLVRCVERRRR